MSFIAVAILGAGALAAGGAIGSSLISSNAAKSAASTQVQAAQTAANTQLGIYNQTRSDLMPYSQFGQSSLSQLARLFGLGGQSPTFGGPASLFGFGAGGPTAGTASNAFSALSQYPGYQFGLNQGVQALDRSAASRGLLLSGAQLKDAQTFGQGYAMQNAWNPYLTQLNNYTSQLFGFGSLGENAAAVSGNQGVTTGQGVANSQLAAGQAGASGIVGSANAITGGIQSGIGTGLNSGLLAYALNNQGIQSALSGPYGGFTPQNYGLSPNDYSGFPAAWGTGGTG